MRLSGMVEMINSAFMHSVTTRAQSPASIATIAASRNLLSCIAGLDDNATLPLRKPVNQYGYDHAVMQTVTLDDQFSYWHKKLEQNLRDKNKA